MGTMFVVFLICAFTLFPKKIDRSEIEKQNS